jgi:drug/metabolite transporter (DMT)-like permease
MPDSESDGAAIMIWLCLVGRIVANPLSNVFQKLLTREQASPLFVVGMTQGLLTLACVPVFLTQRFPADAAFWSNMLVATALAVGANVLIVEALKIGDLSFLGPVNAYKAVFSLIPGFVLLGEIPTPLALTGIGLIGAGSLLIFDRESHAGLGAVARAFVSDRGVQLRFAGLILSATEAVILKRALVTGSPVAAFAVWSSAGFIVSLIAARLCTPGWFGRNGTILKSHWPACLALAVTTGVMQLGTLVVFMGLQVSPALALFQTSMLLTVLLGRAVFREPNFWERLLGAGVMTIGAVLIVVYR